MANIWERGFSQQPQATTTNTFFNPSSPYGGTKDWNTTPVAGQIREQNPQLAYAQYGDRIGVTNQNSAFRDWFFNQYPEFQRGYGLATLRNPLINIDQFTGTLPTLEALQQLFAQQSPYQRGERNAVYAPPARWITR